MRVDQALVGDRVCRRVVADRSDRESSDQGERDEDKGDLGGISPPVRAVFARGVPRRRRAVPSRGG
jgi:hypothetical protein